MTESIYNLVPVDFIEKPKPAIYRSMHPPDGPLTGSTFGVSGTTRLIGAGSITKTESRVFGPKTSAKPIPSAFVRKGTGQQRLLERSSQKGSFTYTDRAKPVIPLRTEQGIVGIRSNTNFVTANAVEAILQVPPVVSQRELNYLEKEDYGKVPQYLAQVKEEIHRENKMVEEYVKDRMGLLSAEEEAYEEMEEAERAELVDKLKSKWDAVNAKYQKMSHMVDLDTVGKVRRKEQMENELHQLEQDIERLERPGSVLVRVDH